jgi:hypothetical protein
MMRHIRPIAAMVCLAALAVPGRPALAASSRTTAVHAPAGMTPVTDQGDTLQCWAVAITSKMDIVASRAAGFPLKLSPKYLMYAKIKSEVVFKIHSGALRLFQGSLCETCAPEPVYYQQDGTLADAVETVKLHGIMPEDAYPDFPQEDEKLFRALNAMFAEYANNSTLPRDEASVSARVTAILDSSLGAPPETFEYRGKRYTPRSFFAAYLRAWQNAGAIELHYWPGLTRGKTVEQAFDGHPYISYWTGNQADVFRILQASLRAHEPALVGSWYLEAAYERDLIGFQINGVKPPAQFDWNDENHLDHYLLVLAAKKDRRNRISRLYVKNTFGIKAKDGYGFNWMERDYFPFILSVEVSDRLVDKFVAKGLLPR